RGVIRAGIWMALISFTFLFYLIPTQILATFLTRALLRWWYRRRRGAGHNARQVLVVGTGPAATAFARQIEDHAELGLRVFGFIGAAQHDVPGRWPLLGPIDDIERVLHSSVVDEVAICLPASDRTIVESVARTCLDEGKIVRMPLEVPHVGYGIHFVEDLDGTAVLSLTSGPDRALALATKRVIDLAGSITALVLLSPVLVIVAVVVLVRDGRPIIFSQARVGLNGRPFRLYKFRTMVRDAEQQVGSLMEQNEVQGRAFKMTADPRVTRTGTLLRRASLDELPQFWNVARGDMSLVGPRPPLPDEVADYDVWHRRRLSMKPGVTGLWQVQARREPEFDRWVERDLEYIDRWSLLLDAKIVLSTIPAVLRLQGR
ncbi:MAG: sugar transferase, partial [Candidatus Limnocylindrales bacterium]